MADLKVALTIAGMDSSGGAGVPLDLRVFSALGVYGTCAVTAVTAQDSRGVYRRHPVPPRLVADQIDAVARDLTISATKIGMLARAHTVELVANRIRRRSLGPVVLDPVLKAKDGTSLLVPRGLQVMKDCLLPLCTLITPNAEEAEALSGHPTHTLEEARISARILYEKGPRYVLIKGGHIPGDEVIDLLFDGQDWVELPSKRRTDPPVHGTGCFLSSAITAYLARGEEVPSAVVKAKLLLERALEETQALGKGSLFFTHIPREQEEE